MPTGIVKLFLSVNGRVCWSCIWCFQSMGHIVDMANICLFIPTDYMAPTHSMVEALFGINGT